VTLPDLAPGATRIVLVRHGEAELPPGVLCGALDPPLSAAGRARMERLRERLARARFAAAYASPARRAAESAALLAAPHGLEVERVPELREVHFGALEGLTFAEASVRYPETCAVWLARPHEVVFPGGEGFAAVRERATRAIAWLLERHEGSTILVVAHGGVNRALLAGALGLGDGDAFGIDQSHGALNVLDLADGLATVRLVNG
jgi:broad specificity phosphatase PhoE